jgi:hypothetical protein
MLDFSHVGGNRDAGLTIQLDRAYAAGEALTVRVRYHTRWVNHSDPEAIWGSDGSGIRFFEPTATDARKRRQAWTSGLPKASRYWFPSPTDASDRHTSELRATVPAPLSVIASGRLLAVEPQPDGARRFHWRMDQAHTSQRSLWVIGEYEDQPQTAAGVALHNFGYPDEAQAVRDSVAQLPATLGFLNELTGVRYPFDSYTQVFVQDLPWGHVGAGLAMQTENMIDDHGTHEDFPVPVGRAADRVAGAAVVRRAPERLQPAPPVAGAWAGAPSGGPVHRAPAWPRRDAAVVRGGQPGHRAGRLGQRATPGPGAAAAGRRGRFRHQQYTFGARSGRAEPAAPDGGRQRLAARAAPLCTGPCRAGRVQCGPAACRAGRDRGRDGLVLRAMAAACRSPGVRSRLAARRAGRPPDDDGPATAGRSAFQGPVDIDIDGQVQRVWLQPQAENVFRFEAPVAPRLVHFDHESAWIKELRFAKPAAELLHQMLHSRDAMGRQWAMGELARLAKAAPESDPLRQDFESALRQLATSPHYWRVRFNALGQWRNLVTPARPGQPAALSEVSRRALLASSTRKPAGCAPGRWACWAKAATRPMPRSTCSTCGTAATASSTQRPSRWAAAAARWPTRRWCNCRATRPGRTRA